MYNIVIQYLYILQNDHNALLISITTQSFLVMWTLKSSTSTLSNFQIYNTVLLTKVIMLYIASPWLIYFLSEVFIVTEQDSQKEQRDRNPIAFFSLSRQSMIHHERYWHLYQLPTLQSPYVIIVIICSIRGITWNCHFYRSKNSEILAVLFGLISYRVELKLCA